MKTGASPLEDQKKTEAEKLIESIRTSRASSFYKDIWKKTNTDSLPITRRENLMGRKFKERLYIKNGLFVKIIYHENIPFLLARTAKDIGEEEYGEINYERPLIFFESSHESTEKGLWHYSRDILPLLSENNLELTLIIAGRYGIDAIMGETESLSKLVGLKIESYFPPGKIKNITLVDRNFDEDLRKALRKAFPAARYQSILALPETGSLGFVCKEKEGRFHPVKNTLLEIIGGRLLATRLFMLPTPIIKYDTLITAKTEIKECQCQTELSFSLL